MPQKLSFRAAKVDEVNKSSSFYTFLAVLCTIIRKKCVFLQSGQALVQFLNNFIIITFKTIISW